MSIFTQTLKPNKPFNFAVLFAKLLLGYDAVKKLVHKTIRLNEATQGEITLSPCFITMIKPVPLGSMPFECGAKTFIAYGKSSMDVAHYYVTEEIAEMMS